ncbi:hypothetical protein [Streptomyces erythrochromogenes]|uniref:hypothetical protein n=1 Tax=Streptomyces erythrochromogenes TaxID=285574 RepID=UPI0036B4D88E
MGSVAAPLLAGFSLTLLGLILQVQQHVRWPDLALLLLGLPVVAFLGSLQYAMRAQEFDVTPADASLWHPDLATSAERRDLVHEEIRAHRAAHVRWAARARTLYNFGICFLLAGLAVMLVPPGTPTPVRWAAVGVVLAGLLGELGLMFAGWCLNGPLRDRLPAPLARFLWWIASADPLVRP